MYSLDDCDDDNGDGGNCNDGDNGDDLIIGGNGYDEINGGNDWDIVDYQGNHYFPGSHRQLAGDRQNAPWSS
jgi:hypothetical protein